MPRFFFNTVDGGRDRDLEGTEYADAAAARIAAIRYAGDVLSDTPDIIWDGKGFRVEVTDEREQLLFTIITFAVDTPAAEDERGGVAG